ncbi:calcium/sodium antiporter [Nonlabens sp. Ci31]|jgi:cation:H+ antiporter|uniref:calcium/sodium antiporter n=1 Tax=Nonlabens sp. Ci31 TaxID=2608253 RepID=UPI0014640EEF|nr:calcium/sodium antiporter [Nonlabens sp. Ci31]QJP32941.1 calcium/sodium antiporter [Nonlabens sp. Ci31]
MSIFYLLIGLVLLVIGGEFLVRSSVGLSLKLHLSRMIIGLTVVSFATSAPELIVSIQSALDGLSGLALGNVIGSNIANIALVLGTTALIAPLAINRDFFKFNWPWMMGFSILLYILLLSGNNLVRWEGAILLSAIVVFLILLIRRARKDPEAAGVEEELQEAKWWKIFLFLFLGGMALWQGSELLVQGAVDIAARLGIPESIIAVSMVAIGTSVPELAASIIAALKKEKAISLGNLIGSNIFNIGSVLGITALIQPIQIEEKGMGLLTNDIYWMLGIAFALLPLAFLPKAYHISRYKGILYLAVYLLFIYSAFSTL